MTEAAPAVDGVDGRWSLQVDDDDDSASMIHEEDPSALRGREWDSMVFVSNTINDQFLFSCVFLCALSEFPFANHAKAHALSPSG